MKNGLHNGYKPNFEGAYIGSKGVMSNEEVCDILAEIIQAPSVNPDESICGRKIIEICEREGLNYQVIPVDMSRDDEAGSEISNCRGINDCSEIDGRSGINGCSEIKGCSKINGCSEIKGCSGINGFDSKRWDASLCDNDGLNRTDNTGKPQRFNIMITLGADSYMDKPVGLLIHGHYDTVPVMEMEDPFGARIIDNKMYGRGVVDQKSGLVSALCALIAVKRSGMKLCKPLCVAAVVDEESEHRGSYTLGMSGMKAEYAIVTEPTNTYRCEFGCRGTTPVKITVKGRTAHAGAPWKGINSIEKAMPILEELFSMKFPELNLGELGILKSTLCVSMINGGSAYNNVPGETVIWMDRRTIPGESNESALKEIKTAVERAVNKCEGWGASVSVEIARPDWHWAPIKSRGLNPTLTDVDCPLYDVLVRAGAKCGITGIEKSLFEGYNDMDFLVNELGIPTLVYGPGDAQMCHGPVEEVDIDDVCRVAEVFCNMAEEMLGE